ncbi:hypothetical protein KY289_009280 [Solanum tuberosum]|nr:hypothetical protein KY289_009280 [Solanum tuberosum]
MAAGTTGGTFPPEEFPPLHGHDTIKPQKIGNGNQNIMQYAQILQPKPMNPPLPKVTPKPVVMLQGEPNITWKASEVRSLVIQENLQYAIIGKFSYGKPVIMELRKTIPGQCGIKSECTIGVLDSRHILIRLNNLEDYVQVLSTAAYYVKARNNYWQMRTLKWDPWFEPDVETTIGVAWISFPDPPPNFFANEAIFFNCSSSGQTINSRYGNKKSNETQLC